MRLKSLELVGFKSFVDRTIVNFEDGVTGIVGPNGCGKCVHGDTRIPLADGRIKSIRGLVEEALNGSDEVQQMDDGEYTYDNPCDVSVLTLNPSTMKLTKSPVLAFVRRTSPDKLLKIQTRSGREIIATEYHPLFIFDGEEIKSVRADELQNGIAVASPRYLPVEAEDDNYRISAVSGSGGSVEYHADGSVSVTGDVRAAPLCVDEKLSPEWGRFLGYIISEGQNSGWSNHVRFVNSDDAVVEDFCGVSKVLFGREPVLRSYKKGIKDCFIFSSVLCNLLENAFDISRGGHSSAKKVPEEIFNAPDSVVWSFLSALIEGDGCIRIDRSKNAHKGTACLEYATASEDLARGLATLLLRLGVRALIRSKNKKAANFDQPGRTYYSVYVYGAGNLKRLSKGLSLVSKKKKLLAEASSLSFEASSLDLLPNVEGPGRMLDVLWRKSGVSIGRDHPLRGRVEAYRQGRCSTSRSGLLEVVAYIRDTAVRWGEELEIIAGRLDRLATSDLYWDEITSVEEVPGDEWVYDLCVAGTHNFVANDLVVHNSNVVDAIRWVMGEQSAKHLRGSNMGDVIFNGTESRPPMGMASVFLTFDNSDGRAPAEYADYTEITVGRRLYRSGESEYYINKTPCRLKDIIDIFLGTGVGTRAYAIVEQGMIGQILSQKPEDRRTLIEEAAGISKFKLRKESALRKMESTKANLARLADILGELQRQINSLYRQAKKAERFKKYSGELKDLELKVSARQYENLKSELDILKRNLGNFKESEVSGGSKLSLEETDIERFRITLNELEIDLDGLQESLYEKQNEVQLTEADVSYKTREIGSLSSQIERWNGEIEDLKTKIKTWSEEVSSVNTEKVQADLKWFSADEGLKGINAEIDRAREDHHQLVVELEDSRRAVFECIEQVSASNSHLEQAKRREIEVKGWIEKDQAEIDKIDEQIKDVEAKISSRSGDISGTRQLRLQLDGEIKAAKETLNIQTEDLEKAEARVESLKEELSNKRSRLVSLEELHKNYEGYKDGVKAVLRRSEEDQGFQGVVGTINEILETKPEYESAVGAVLGEKLQYVVVKSREVGVEAVDYLKAAVSGRSTFVPIEVRSEKQASAVSEEDGVIGPLVNFVSYTDDYKKIADYLFGDVLLVEDLKKALNIWEGNGCNHTLVTLDGEVIDPAGVVTGGSGGDGSEQLMIHRREIKELSTAVAALIRELSLECEISSKLRDRVGGLRRNIEKLEQESRHEELKHLTQEKDIHHLEQEVGYYRAQRDKLTVELAALAEEQGTVAREMEGAEVLFKTGSAKKAELEGKVSESHERETGLRAKLEELTQKRSELDLQLKTEKEKAEVREREIDRLTGAVAEAYSGIASRWADIVLATQTVNGSRFSIDCKRGCLTNLIRAISDLKDRHTEVKNRYDEGLALLREKEASIRDLRRGHEEQLKNMHEIELSLTQKNEKSNYMCREIFDRYRIDLAQSYYEYLSDDLELESSAERVAELKEKVDNIGSVNVEAINEYEELKTRHDFLKVQHDDLTASMEDLHKAVQKINKTSRVRFHEAFESVNERFQKLFPKLFEGGKAHLSLIDDQNVLESGVDIVAQPPGKKLQSITLLSGGEKALTAVALIFALFLHHPSPFCLLDEVDAPLDDANIDRFNDLIREMTKLSQFILITHNKRTMELADTLYGVTMEERGASKVISLSLTHKKSEAQAA